MIGLSGQNHNKKEVFIICLFLIVLFKIHFFKIITLKVTLKITLNHQKTEINFPVEIHNKKVLRLLLTKSVEKLFLALKMTF